MQDSIKLLIKLQEIDTTILRKKNIIDSMPSKILAVEQSFKEAQSLYNNQKQRCELFEKKKKEKDRELEDINERINKLKARTTEIKTNKEYQAHLKEIENVEKERYKVEDEILSAMEAIESATKETKTEELKIKTEKDKLEAFKKEVEREKAEAERELNEGKSKRAEIANAIDPDIYKDYITVLKTYAGLAVVEVRDGICQGCNMSIPPQIFVEIKKNEEIIQCPQCRRILYWKETE